MPETSPHRKLSDEGLRLWEAGELERAAASYEAAIAACPPEHWAYGDYYSQLGGVLAAMGRHEEARTKYEIALEFAIGREDEGDSAVATARYFLGQHCLSLRAFEDAIAAVSPSLQAGAPIEAPRRYVRALALAGLDRKAEARAEANAALAAARTEPHRERLRTELAELLTSADEQ